MLWSIDSCQNRVSADRIAGSGVDPSRSSIFEVIRWQVTSFQMIAVSSLIFLSFIWNMFCFWAVQLKFWSQAAITGREDSCFWLCSPWSCVGHALRPFFMLWLVKIWQVSSCGKFMQHLESCLLWKLAPVVQTLDSTIQWINIYPVDSVIGFPSTYPLDSDLSDG